MLPGIILNLKMKFRLAKYNTSLRLTQYFIKIIALLGISSKQTEVYKNNTKLGNKNTKQVELKNHCKL